MSLLLSNLGIVQEMETHFNGFVFRNIPNDVTEAEIIHLGIPFGRVTNVLVLKGKNQAFLEMEEEPSAISMVNYFTNCVAQLRERSVYVQFSNHTSLKTDQTHSNASASAQAALQVKLLGCFSIDLDTWH